MLATLETGAALAPFGAAIPPGTVFMGLGFVRGRDREKERGGGERGRETTGYEPLGVHAGMH